MSRARVAGVRRAAVLGSPVGHSLSPVLHRTAYAELGLSGWTYDAHDVTEETLQAFVSGLDETWAGLSLTMPLKAAVIPLLDETTAVVDAVGAANTVLLTGGRRSGDNTDVPGMVAALAAHSVTSVPRAIVLGGGATARSAVAALASLTRNVAVHARTASRAQSLHAVASAYGIHLDVSGWTDDGAALDAPLVISTVVRGATDALAASIAVTPRHATPRLGMLFEVLYDPWPTPLAAAWTAAGGRVVDGLDLLVHQAVLQVAAMTGTALDRPAADSLARVMRSAGELALRSR